MLLYRATLANYLTIFFTLGVFSLGQNLKAWSLFSCTGTRYRTTVLVLVPYVWHYDDNILSITYVPGRFWSGKTHVNGRAERELSSPVSRVLPLKVPLACVSRMLPGTGIYSRTTVDRRLWTETDDGRIHPKQARTYWRTILITQPTNKYSMVVFTLN